MRFIPLKLSILASLGAICGPGAAQVAQPPRKGLTGFLERIDGSTDVRLLDRGNRPKDQPTARFVDDASVIGVRYFHTNRHVEALADAKRAQIAFSEECIAADGFVEPDTSPVGSLQRR